MDIISLIYCPATGRYNWLTGPHRDTWPEVTVIHKGADFLVTGDLRGEDLCFEIYAIVNEIDEYEDDTEQILEAVSVAANVVPSVYGPDQRGAVRATITEYDRQYESGPADPPSRERYLDWRDCGF